MSLVYYIHDTDGNRLTVMDMNGEPVQDCVVCDGLNGSEHPVRRTYLAGANSKFEWLCAACEEKAPRCTECGHLCERDDELLDKWGATGLESRTCCACLPNGWEDL